MKGPLSFGERETLEKDMGIIFAGNLDGDCQDKLNPQLVVVLILGTA